MSFDPNRPQVTQRATNLTSENMCSGELSGEIFMQLCSLTHCEGTLELMISVPLALSGQPLGLLAITLIGALCFTTLVFTLLGVLCLRK